MKVLVLGGTGSIGGAIVQALREREHEVLALGRSPEACRSLRMAGATPIEGDLRDPTKWIDVVENVDGVLQAAATWGDDMGDVDRLVALELIKVLQRGNASKALIYTGGCWLYGATGDSIATEDTPFKPLASFAWTIPTMNKVLSAPGIRGMVIHPAMVYERNGGVFEHIFEDAKQLGYVRVVGGENIRWPLVHRDDLAELYVLMLENGKSGDVFNAATVSGLSIGSITRTVARRLGIQSDPIVCDVATATSAFGSWAEGYALDQQMSGQKAMDELGWLPEHTDVIADIS